jgi:FkbM family methyltransferase
MDGIATATNGVNLFGAGGFARDTAAALRAAGPRVNAFLTSGEPRAPTLDGLPWRRLQREDLQRHPLWIAAFNHQAASDYGRLRQWLGSLGGEAPVVWPQAWYGALQERLGWRFWLQPPEAYAAVRGELAAARERLDDEASRAAFDSIVAFRSEAAQFTSPPPPCSLTQYLPRWLLDELRRQGVTALRIVDGGAYQGETLRELGEKMPIEQAWAFEPDAANFAALQRQMSGWNGRLAAIDAGLSDRSGELAFTAGAGAASSVSAGGAQRIRALALDEALQGAAVNFVKLDVEGHELPALAGARETIRRCHPVLAISAYHRWDDLWRIPAFVDGLGLGYRLRLAVHQHNSFDTVLYAY